MATHLSILLVACAVLVALGGATSLERSPLKPIPSDKERGELYITCSLFPNDHVYTCCSRFTNRSPPPPDLLPPNALFRNAATFMLSLLVPCAMLTRAVCKTFSSLCEGQEVGVILTGGGLRCALQAIVIHMLFC